MKILIALVLLFSLLTVKVNAQIKTITYAQLQDRISHPDTLYIVNFWATWCGPCVAELPNFEKLRLANLKKPVKVLLVSLDFKSKLQKEVIPFVLNNKINAEVFLLNEPDQQQ